MFKHNYTNSRRKMLHLVQSVMWWFPLNDMSFECVKSFVIRTHSLEGRRKKTYSTLQTLRSNLRTMLLCILYYLYQVTDCFIIIIITYNNTN